MSNGLLASVIIVNYNMASFVSDCLDALLHQEMPAEQYEIIFADNGSSDGSAERAEAFAPPVRLLRFDRNYGFAEGNNRAAQTAGGRYLAFLNTDTIVHRRWLPELVKAMQTYPGLGAVQSNMLMPWCAEFDPPDPERMPENLYYYDFARYGYTLYRQRPFSPQPFCTLFLTGASVMIDRSLHPQLETPWDPLFRYVEDIDLSLRINALGFSTALVPTSVVYHRHPLSTKVGVNLSSFQKVVAMFANRYLAFFKSLYTAEFLRLWPWLVTGTLLKLTSIGWSRSRQAAYLLPGALSTITAQFALLAKMPRAATRRRQLLAARRRPAGWFYEHIVEEHRPPLTGAAYA